MKQSSEIRKGRYVKLICVSLLIVTLTGCATSKNSTRESMPPQLTVATNTHLDLIRLPRTKGKIITAVYGFRDQTGQYKPSSENQLSTAVTQGASSMLVKALKDSEWFIPVEREGLQNLLTERKIIRALELNDETKSVPPLLSAGILIEGGIIAYDSNVKTGGTGARYLGIGINRQYRVDQVTVNLRAVDVRTGQILNSISTTKTIYSHQLAANLFRFTSFKNLLESDMGYTSNEPSQLCVQDAIESAVIHLIAEGIQDNSWALFSADDLASPVLKKYIDEAQQQKGE